MDPILRRCSFFYLSHLVTFSGLLGPHLVTGDWPAFDIIPLFMPVWLASSVLFSELGESYPFLRNLPVTDRAIVHRKLGLVLATGAVYWLLILGVALARSGDGSTTVPTLAFITLVCAYGTVVAACCQIGIWQFGRPVMTGVIATYMVLNLAAALVHTANLRHQADWPVLAQLAPVRWLAGISWLGQALVISLALSALYGLARVGTRVKTSSEACL